MKEKLKRMAAESAAELVQDGDVVGLGTGSTARHVLMVLQERVKREKLRITGIPTSSDTRILAAKLGLELGTLEEHPELDIAIDGADQLTERLELIKGGGGALFREKVVACCAKRFVVVADESKLCERLSMPVPVEVLPFAWKPVELALRRAGALEVRLRTGSGKAGPVLTDNGNYILDVDFGRIEQPERLEAEIAKIVGVVECGIFCPALVSEVHLGTRDGVRVLRRPAGGGNRKI
ncbi:MAG: ribose-5-phosphate isomerase RpiA [Euryarchaeota archaeon]|nr:ribose-5-phosphate isomerase RpiA [Euryarchaeota archaeon]